MNLDQLMHNSNEAFRSLKKINHERRANFLCSIADEIEALGDDLLETASEESNLPIVRFQGERARTCGQLRMFANFITNGSWLKANIDLAQADRLPLPKADIRSTLTPLGPIAVFGASNFPLAYSTVGGDTASALAAGCSVIYKAHPSHLKTSTMVASAVTKAITKHDFPEASFIHYVADDFAEVKKMVQHPLLKGVGFTGSFHGGMSILAYANERKIPIPVFAEMGSVNPVFLLANALESATEKWVEQYASAITMGVGQFCTKPGLLIGIEGKSLEKFSLLLAQKIASVKDFKMLSQGIYDNYQRRKEEVSNVTAITNLAVGTVTETHTGVPTLVKVSGRDFIQHPTLHEEVFGPFSIIVSCRDIKEMIEVIDVLGGQLTSSIIADEGDAAMVDELIPNLQRKAGRLIFNGVPTGVEVCDAMVHGGPFPATTDARFTAVGNNAVYRWMRPIAFQNFPQEFLPIELKNENSQAILRKVNGQWTNVSIT